MIEGYGFAKGSTVPVIGGATIAGAQQGPCAALNPAAAGAACCARPAACRSCTPEPRHEPGCSAAHRGSLHRRQPSPTGPHRSAPTPNPHPNPRAGFFASACSLPFDFIKTRMQKMTPNPDGTMPYAGPMDCAMQTLRKEVRGAARAPAAEHCASPLRLPGAAHPAAARPALPAAAVHSAVRSAARPRPRPRPRRRRRARSSSTPASPPTSSASRRTSCSRSCSWTRCPSCRPRPACRQRRGGRCKARSGCGGRGSLVLAGCVRALQGSVLAGRARLGPSAASLSAEGLVWSAWQVGCRMQAVAARGASSPVAAVCVPYYVLSGLSCHRHCLPCTPRAAVASCCSRHRGRG
jgi:hypothetical protein